MIEELEPLDMLDISTNEQGIKTYKATDKLMSYHMNYTRWLFAAVQLLGLRQTSSAIAELEGIALEKE